LFFKPRSHVAPGDQRSLGQLLLVLAHDLVCIETVLLEVPLEQLALLLVLVVEHAQLVVLEDEEAAVLRGAQPGGGVHAVVLEELRIGHQLRLCEAVHDLPTTMSLADETRLDVRHVRAHRQVRVLRTLEHEARPRLAPVMRVPDRKHLARRAVHRLHELVTPITHVVVRDVVLGIIDVQIGHRVPQVARVFDERDQVVGVDTRVRLLALVCEKREPSRVQKHAHRRQAAAFALDLGFE
jgi:hypothetical protein